MVLAKGGSPKMPPLDISDEEVWKVYKSMPEPASAPMVRKALLEKGHKCSLTWTKNKLKTLRLLNPDTDPEIADVKSLMDFLVKIGKGFDEYETLKGVQSRLLAVLSVRMAKNQADPEYLKGLMEVYAMVTTELQKTYQHRINASETIKPVSTPASTDDTDEGESNVTQFTRPGGKAKK